MPRKKIAAGNWKMNLTPKKAEEFAREMKKTVNTDAVDVVLCVPFVHLNMVQEIVAGTHIKVGAQNMHYMDDGAYTGEISAKMLAGMNVPYVIIGHSERREYFGETDTSVNLKALKALQNEITPIICIGETSKQRKSGRTFNVIRKQLNIALDEMTSEDITKIVIAYEPIWAIGTGETATKEQAEEVCDMIRKQIHSHHGHWASDNVRILYGGSVTDQNANELFTMPNIDGGLVGGASLKSSFKEVVNFG
ncbi:MAG: triose-phosphate isomerase [Defluviitaleaceae bacterium]|nr:triose-phosphate isomerase [Defluviitaleaceae bacterium]